MSQTTAETPEQALARAVQAGTAGRPSEARGICQDVLVAHPEHPAALALLGSLAGRAGQMDEAISLLERAVARLAEVSSWHANLCSLYRATNRLDDALRAGQEAVRLAPDNAPHRVDLGLVHLTRSENQAALACFIAALGRDAENPNAHMALGELLLSLGEFRAGWMEYEWRNKLDQAKGTLPKMSAAAWNGMRMPGARLLLVADQGFGDMMQFARYIPRVVERVGEVVVGWGPEVVALLSGVPGVAASYVRFSDIPPHEAYCLMSSLPGLFATELDTIPWTGPYLYADPGKRAEWAARLGPRDGRCRVGLAWAGRPTHPNNARRSVQLDELAPILATGGIEFLTVQKPVAEADQVLLRRWPQVRDASAALADFAETAALLMNLDLVISVDTSVVHLAGALGVPCWVLLPRPADWRWLHGRTDSPWYPSVRLFRQERPQDWARVVEALAAALARLAAGHGATARLEPPQRQRTDA